MFFLLPGQPLFLNDQEIEDFLNRSDQELSDDEDETDETLIARADHVLGDILSAAPRQIFNDDESDFEDDPAPVPSEPGPTTPGPSTEPGPTAQAPSAPRLLEADSQVRELLWLKRPMPNRETVSISEEPVEVTAPSNTNPLFSFLEYLPLSFWELITEQTNLYSVQTRDHKSVTTNMKEMIHYAGIQMMMGTLSYPQAKLYWNRLVAVPIIQSAMTKNRFFELRHYLHFSDNDAPHTDDRLWKVRPIIDPVLRKCNSLPKTTHLSIDEQMIPFSGRCQFRQFIPSKPNPLGIKNFVLASKDGLVLDFHIYVGSTTIPEGDKKELGVGGGVVKLLLRTVTENCSLYTDRFFTSLKLAEYLNVHMQHVHLTGTVLKNRIGPVASKLEEDKKLARGSWDERVRSDDRMCVVKWKDSKPVLMLSTCVGSSPETTCRRWDKDVKRKVEVTQPAIVKNYNSAMGGIDLCDRLISFYRSSMRTKKWTTRFFCHMLDLCVVNCWIAYMRACKEELVPPKNRMGLLEFRMEVSIGLMNYQRPPQQLYQVQGTRTSPRLSSELQEQDENSEDEDEPPSTPARKKPRTVVPQPTQNVRFDQVGHFPRHVPNSFASKCRKEGCKSRTRIVCTKCNVYLCISNNNCFELYHTP